MPPSSRTSTPAGSSVPTAWISSFAELFAALNDEARSVLTDATGASWAPRRFEIGDPEPAKPAAKPGKARQARQAAPGLSAEQVRAATLDSLRALMMIRVYRVRGHLEAQLDPLGLTVPKPHPELDPATYGFTEADLDRPIFIDNVLGRETATLREILAVLRQTYCGPIGVEYMHIQDPEQKAWLQTRIEGAPWLTELRRRGEEDHPAATDGGRGFRGVLPEALRRHQAVRAGRWRGHHPRAPRNDRAGGQGRRRRGRDRHAASRAPEHAGQHRAQALHRAVQRIRRRQSQAGRRAGLGRREIPSGHQHGYRVGGHSVHISLQPNPSHLEAVDPVVVGKVRARQDAAGDTKAPHSVMGILMHGDAAFAGQGLVYETLAMSQLIGYRTGGTIHLVVNNQIGFTTVPLHAYSGLYCTDVAKSIQAPILHVNGDNPEAVVFCARLAAEFRQEFATDFVLDIVCYRRHGHNETDEPAFTQPIMYRAIRDMKTTRTLYAEKLAAEGTSPGRCGRRCGTASRDAGGELQGGAELQAQQGGLAGGPLGRPEAGRSGGRTLRGSDGAHRRGRGGDRPALASVPADFDANPKIVRQLEAKRAAFEKGEGIDWATGEALAFGGCCWTATASACPARTVSAARSASAMRCWSTRATPMNTCRSTTSARARPRSTSSTPCCPKQGVLGFEYGYSLADPTTLVLWEAQFGDFANGAQVIIDQFLASGETKWLRMSGLTLLLPHGYEGQGPEHSSARLERYLQLCAEQNMTVANITTPANYFHALRRQLKRNFRKPLVIMTPKSLLRHKLAVSPLSEFTGQSRFQHVIPEIDAIGPADAVTRVVMCTGKVYYDLLAERRDKDMQTWPSSEWSRSTHSRRRRWREC